MQIRYWFWAFVVIVFFGVVGQMDYEAAEAEAAAYCDNVKNGAWPDYNGTYKKYCK